jgi:hypothetical protein
MSGGSYDYKYREIQDLAESIANRASYNRPDEYAKRKAFALWLTKAAEVAKAIEWNDSLDSAPEDEAKAMEAFLACTPKADVVRELIEHAERVKVALDASVKAAKPMEVVFVWNVAKEASK